MTGEESVPHSHKESANLGPLGQYIPGPYPISRVVSGAHNIIYNYLFMILKFKYFKKFN